MAMRVWLYARLSNDDDPAQNSLQNQQAICCAFAEKQSWTIVGSSTDDNISGMNFSRRRLDTLTAAVPAKQIDAVLVKDLSRLGRHRTQTALFIDFLREKQVRVISVTEGVDTFCEEDDLMIGVRSLMNDYYAKDIGKKIRAGYRQKQKDGLVITPPFGYWKDRNTNQVLVQPEAAETVQLIYALYLQGCGQKEIARRLNRLGRKTPAQIMTERLGYDSQKPHKTRDGQFLWTYASVKNILVEEAYTGVLVNHRRECCGGKARAVNEADWLRHENFYPVIIEKADWKQVQALLKQQARPAVNNRTEHRYHRSKLPIYFQPCDICRSEPDDAISVNRAERLLFPSDVDQTIFQQLCIQISAQELLFYLSQKSFFLWCEFFVHIIPPISVPFLNAKRALVIGL